MSSIDVPPGWHPDPQNPTCALRWWDGAQWTSHVHAVPQAVAQPVPPVWGGPPPVGSWGGPQQWGAPQPAPGPEKQPWASTSSSPPPWQGSPFSGPGGPVPGVGYGSQSWFARSRNSVYALGIAAVYVLVALTAHLVFFGILPILFSVRAARAKEPLAPVAITATVLTVALGLLAFAR